MVLSAGGMTDAHRLFVQGTMSERILKEELAKKMSVDCHQAFQISGFNVASGFNDFIHTINENLRLVGLELSRVISEDDGLPYWAMINREADDFSKLATEYQPMEIEIYNRIIELIIGSPDGTVSSIDILNLAPSLTKTTAKAYIEAALQKFTSDMWLSNDNGEISLSPRAIAELQGHLHEAYGDAISECIICSSVVFKCKVCDSCGKKTHHHCANRVFAHTKKCPLCKEDFFS